MAGSEQLFSFCNILLNVLFIPQHNKENTDNEENTMNSRDSFTNKHIRQSDFILSNNNTALVNDNEHHPLKRANATMVILVIVSILVGPCLLWLLGYFAQQIRKDITEHGWYWNRRRRVADFNSLSTIQLDKRVDL